ncbi:magnesium/cobalt transporter CorA [Paraconexibacter algicola]|uniref:Magnesium transport protein CorA n=1 Tax=Paraconexibacter algicola TaxID=2133960 RepID=A0A2T4UBA2_9ACTN|nr:magnesium and cobalt transport protein CorA [Paraconexibacter algicola]
MGARGARGARRVIVDCALYEDGVRRPGTIELADALESCRHDGRAFVWIGLHEPDEAEFDAVRDEFRLHELAIEDAVVAHQRPKLEVYGDHVFVVLKTVEYRDPDEVIDVGEILMFVAREFIVTVRHGRPSPLSEVRGRLEARPELLKLGPSAVFHAIVDRIVDDYEPAVLGVENDIQEVEAQVFTDDRTSNPTERIFRLEREVLQFQRAVVPLATPLDRLARGQFDAVHDDLHSYFRDVHDHLLRVSSQIDTQRQLLSSALQAYLAQVSVRQNDDMRRIAAWAAILAVPTALAGIYGMNFEHMPELRWQYGYPLVIAVMATICSLLYRRLRRAGWL